MPPSHSLPHMLPNQPTNSPDFNLQMPNVFVVPPEEDQAPPWCCFDAAAIQNPQPPTHTLSTKPDMDSLQSRLNFVMTERVIAGGTPIFHRPASQEQVVMPKKMENRVALREGGDDDAGNTGNDSEVVEVVKVSRSRKDKDVPPIQRGAPGSSNANSLKRSTTFRHKAAKAFSSIRSLGKGTKHRKPATKDAFTPSSHSQPSRAASFSSFGQDRNLDEGSGNDHPQSSQSERPTMSRRGSVILSQIFSPKIASSPDPVASPFDSIPSVSSSIISGSSQSTIDSNHSAFPSLQLQRIPNTNYQPPGQEAHIDSEALPSPQSEADRLTADSQYGRPTSPSLTINTLPDKQSKRRFSMMSIRQIFAFSPSTSTHSNIPNSDSAASSNADARDSDAASLSDSELGVQLDTPRLSRTTAVSSSTDSSDSSSGVGTPTDEVAFLPMAASGNTIRRTSLDWRIPELDSMGSGLSTNLADGLGDLGGAGSSRIGSAVRPQRSNAKPTEDASLEMQLDSLHFDSLSFDPEHFNISEILKD